MSDGNANTGLIPVNRWWNGEFHHVWVFEKNAQKTAKTSKQIKDTLWHWNFKCSRNLARYCCWTSVPLDLQSCHWQRPSGTALTSQGSPSQDRSAHSPNPRPHPSWQSYSGTRWNLGKWRADLDKVHSIAAIQKNTRKPTARTGLLLVVPSRKSQYLPGAATCRKLGARQWQTGEQQLWQPWSGTCCDILPTQCFLIIWSFKYLQTILVILDHFSLYVYSRAACPACPEAVSSWSTNSGQTWDLFPKLAVLTSSVGVGFRKFSWLAARGVPGGCREGCRCGGCGRSRMRRRGVANGG